MSLRRFVILGLVLLEAVLCVERKITFLTWELGHFGIQVNCLQGVLCVHVLCQLYIRCTFICTQLTLEQCFRWNIFNMIDENTSLFISCSLFFFWLLWHFGLTALDVLPLHLYQRIFAGVQESSWALLHPVWPGNWWAGYVGRHIFPYAYSYHF